MLGALTIIPAASASAGSMPGQGQQAVEGRGFDHVAVLPALLPNSKENTSTDRAEQRNRPTATIVMDIYTPGGVLIPSATVAYTGNVPPGGTRVFAQAINTGLTPGFRGVGVISSDQPINALLVRDIESNVNYAKSYSIHNAYATGGTKVTLPYVANALNGLYNTRFAIANTGNAEACVGRLRMRSRGRRSRRWWIAARARWRARAAATGSRWAARLLSRRTAWTAPSRMPASTQNRLMAATLQTSSSTSHGGWSTPT
ncbi:hypothetical protein O0235_09500 [Tepidiforma flava]|uniref:Uncharacterized protein n=1 Tax=Tepidiforma flava TaxID=3004094 RepID=A0ABY7M5H0_9CHLR|nr:hypothetical protein [Tepidiforma flava]WBL35021.1 hypothetical protein O0235_09500 [Tepidiforma flava]